MIICFIILMLNRRLSPETPQQLRRKLQVTFTENILFKSLADCITLQDYFKFSLSFCNLFKNKPSINFVFLRHPGLTDLASWQHLVCYVVSLNDKYCFFLVTKISLMDNNRMSMILSMCSFGITICRLQLRPNQLINV